MPETGAIAQTDDDFEEEKTGSSSQSTSTEEKAFTQADVDRIVADRVNREKSKYKDYNDLKRKAAAAMTDNERALAEAEARGESKAVEKAAVRLATAEFRAEAAGQVSKEALAGFLEFADMKRFIGEDGEPDTAAIQKAVKRLSGTAPSTNYDGGARTNSAKPNSMSALIRQQAGLGG